MDGSRWDPTFLWDGKGRDIPGWWEHGCARQEGISGIEQLERRILMDPSMEGRNDGERDPRKVPGHG